MKNAIKFFTTMRSITIIALVAAIGFSMAACPNGGSGSKGTGSSGGSDSGGGSGSSNIPAELIAKWYFDEAKTMPAFEFTSSKFILNTFQMDVRVTGKKIEVGLAGSYDIFCDSYNVSGKKVTITGGMASSLGSASFFK